MNNFNLSGMDSIVFNGTSLDKVVFNGTEVWSAGYNLTDVLALDGLTTMTAKASGGTYVEGDKPFTEIGGAWDIKNGTNSMYYFDVSGYNTLYLKGSNIYDGTLSSKGVGNGCSLILYVQKTTTSGATYDSQGTIICIPYKSGNTDTGGAGTATFDLMVDISQYSKIGLKFSIYFEDYDEDMYDYDWATDFRLTIDEMKFGNRTKATSSYYLLKNNVDVSGMGISTYTDILEGRATLQSGVCDYQVVDEYYNGDSDSYYSFDGSIIFKSTRDNNGNALSVYDKFHIYNTNLQYTNLHIKYKFVESEYSSSAYWSAYASISFANGYAYNARYASGWTGVNSSFETADDYVTLSFDISNVYEITHLSMHMSFDFDGYSHQFVISDIWLS